LGCQGL